MNMRIIGMIYCVKATSLSIKLKVNIINGGEDRLLTSLNLTDVQNVIGNVSELFVKTQTVHNFT